MNKILILGKDELGKFITHEYRKKQKPKRKLAVGDSVKFISGNFYGLTGQVKKVDWNSEHPNAIYGFYHEVLLSNGNIGFIEKSEHWEIINR